MIGLRVETVKEPYTVGSMAGCEGHHTSVNRDVFLGQIGDAGHNRRKRMPVSAPVKQIEIVVALILRVRVAGMAKPQGLVAMGVLHPVWRGWRETGGRQFAALSHNDARRELA